jgi:hypothetical protein
MKRRFLRLERARPSAPTPAPSLSTPGRFARATSTSTSTPTSTSTATTTMPPDEVAAMRRAEADAMFARLELEERGGQLDPRVVAQVARVAVPLLALVGGGVYLLAGGCSARLFSTLLVAAVVLLGARARRFRR